MTDALLLVLVLGVVTIAVDLAAVLGWLRRSAAIIHRARSEDHDHG